MDNKDRVCMRHPDRRAKCRDLCTSCYTYAAFLVNNGRTTWSKMEKSGQAGSAKVLNRWVL